MPGSTREFTIVRRHVQSRMEQPQNFVTAAPAGAMLEESSSWPGVLRTVWTFARRNPLSAVWGVVAILIIVMAATAPLIAPNDPLKANFLRMTKPPDAQNYFGTDQIGRDTLSRVIYGARASLIVAIAAVLLGTTTGQRLYWRAV